MEMRLKYAVALLLGAVLAFLFAWNWGPKHYTGSIQLSEGERGLESTQARPETPRTPEKSARGKVLTGDGSMSLAAINEIQSEFEQSLSLYRKLDGLDAQAIALLIDDARQTITGRDYVAATSIMYGRLAELDFEFALQQLTSASSGAQPSWLRAVFHAVARLNLPHALDAARDLSMSDRQIAANAILTSRDDLPLSERQSIATDLNVVVPGDALVEDPAGAWQQALNIQNPNARMRRLASLVSQWARWDPEAAIAAAGELPPNLRMSMQARVLSHWAASDFDGAWAWIQSNPPSQRRNSLTQMAVRRLGEIDIEQARTVALSLSDSEREQALQAILLPWAQQDPDGVLAWLDAQDSRRPRYAAIQSLLPSFATDTAFLDRLMSRLSSEETRMADSMLISVLGLNDPPSAVARVEAMADPDRRAAAAQNLVQQWTQVDRTAALQWIDSRRRNERGPLYQAYTGALAQWDHEGALAFARGLNSPEMRDQALLGVVPGLSDVDSLESIYQEVENKDIRTQLAARIYHQLREVDPARAERYRRAAGG